MNKFTRLWVSLISLTLFIVFSAFRFTGLPDKASTEKMYADAGKMIKDATSVRRFATEPLKKFAVQSGFKGRNVTSNSNISLTVPGNMSFSNTPGTCGKVVTYTAPTAQADQVSVEYNFASSIQTFTVPAGVTSITIKGIGADGGNSLSSGVNGGRGASLTGTFAVTPGQTIYMVVGQRGSDDYPDFGLGAAGGGGGTYVSATPFGTASASPLLVAGGGGGAAAIVDNNIHANANSIDGNYGVTGDGGDGALGSGGTGGEAGTNSGAGAGWLSDGLSDINSGDFTGGFSQFATNPFLGGTLFGVIYGGYGGGGAAGFVGGGGGGGYSGGGGGGDNGGGGGGGSFNGGTNPINIPGTDGDDGAGGNGKVVITYGTSVTITQIAGLPSGANFPVGVTTNTFQATDGVNTTTASFTVTVNDTEIPVISAPDPVTYTIPAGAANCGAAAVSLGTPTVSDNCGVNIPTNNAPALFPLGNTTVTWSVTDIHGNPATATQVVTVIAPEVSVADASLVLEIPNGSTSIDLSTGTDFGTTNINTSVTRTYTIANTAGTADLSVQSINIAGANPSFFTIGGITLPITVPAGQTSTFTVTYTAAAGGTHNAIVQLNNNDCNEAAYTFAIRGVTNQATTPITGITSVCTSGTTQLSNATPGGSWSSDNTSVATVDANGLVSAVSAGTANISYVMPGGTVQVTVTVNPVPTASISASGSTTFCAGGSVTLTATGGASYLWSNGATTQSITVTSGGTYSVVATSAEGCSSTAASTSVTVNPVPTASISASGSTTFCAGGSVTLTATGGASYLWSNGATTASITVSEAGTYSVVATSAEGCASAAASTNVTVNPVPTASISASGSTTFCAGGSVTLTATGGATYLWSNGATTASITVTSGGTYSVVATSAEGCSSAAASTSVTVNPVPTASISANGSTTFCAGGSATLTATGGASYLWSNGATTASITVTEAGTYSVVATSAEGCSSTSASTSVTVNPVPTASINASGSTTFCAGGSVTLTATGGASYLWSNGATTQSITVTSGGTYSVVATSAEGCSSASASTSVTVNPVPTASISASGSTTFCAGGSVTLTATGGASYLWSNGATTASITVSEAGTYSVVATSAEGCSSASASTSVTVNPVPTAAISASGSTTFCAGGSVTLTATGGASYLWSNGATTASITVSEAGTYSVVATSAEGCSSASASTSVTVNPVPTASISANGSTTFCAGGSVILTATGGASYLWSNGATTASITVTEAGTYSVVATSAEGCSSTAASTSVTVNPVPTASISANGSTTFCAGGSVTLTATGGASYLWSNGATTVSITVTEAGTYSVVATSAEGCSSTAASTSVTVNPVPTASISANGSTTFCAGGSVTLTATGGASYLWSNGATTQSITVTEAGTYSVVATSAEGCSSASASTSVTVNPVPTATISASGSTAFCAGGSVTLTATGGASYLWSNGATTASITVTEAGTYSVVATSAEGCSSAAASTSVTVNPVPAAAISASGSTTFCAGGSVTLTATGGASYLWSNGATTASITVSEAGTYSVVATSAEGCLSTAASTSVTVNPVPTASISANGSTTFCAGGSVTLTATGGASYLWSNGATTQSITITNGGTYSVVATSAEGCSSASASTSVTVNAVPTVNTVTDKEVCHNGVQVPAINFTGSIPGTVFNWINNTPSIGLPSSGTGDIAAFTALNPGTTPVYATITVTPSYTNPDGSVCTGVSTSFQIRVNPIPVFAAIANQSVCNGATTNAVTFNSPVAGVTYSWFVSNPAIGISNGSGATLPAFTAINNSNVPVVSTITVISYYNGETGGCGTSRQFGITVQPTPTATISANGPTTFCAGGSVTLTATGGASYLWSNGATTQSITVTNGGTYSVVATSAEGCSSASASTSVTVNPVPTAAISASGSTTFCAGGSVTLTATGGASYLWSNGATTASITVSEAGTYSVIATSEEGCSSASASTVVTVNPVPTAAISASGSTTFCAGGSVTLTATGGASYLWSNGATTASITVSEAGTYSVVATSAEGCSSASASTSVTVNPVPTAAISASGSTTFCAGGSVTLTATGGASYLWSNGATTESITVSEAGTYSVVATSAEGCSSASASTSVTVNPVPTASISASGSTTFCAGGSVTLTATGGASYLWSNGAITASITVTEAGTYSVVATSAEGCSSTSASTSVTVNPVPTAAISANGPTTFCAGGSVTLTATEGASYLWSNGATTASITVTEAGTYSVKAISGTGCESEPVSQTVTVTPQPVANITAGGPLNFCPGGSVTLDAGVANSYLWSNGATTRTITVNTSGNYSVTINNGNNCTATSSAVTVTVGDNIAPSITAPANITVTYGQTVVLGNATASDNCSVTVTNNAPSVFPVGVTIVTWTATDGSGNTKTAQQTVTVLAPATCSSAITVIPENSLYTGGVPTDIYLGYGPQKVTLKVNASGGTSYTYTWTSVSGGGTLSNSASSQPVFAPSAAGIYVFKVQVRTQSGCVTTSTVTICVKDIRVKDNDDSKCDHKSHSYRDCKHSQHNHSKCDHKSHDKNKCKDKYDDGDDDDDECDHRSHDSKNCKHKGHRHNQCDHRSHNSSSCKNKYDDHDDDDHDGDDDDNYKVYICHVPPGNTGNPLTLSISINAVESHLRNHPGDRLGSCGTQNSCAVSQPPVCTSTITADGSTTFCTGGSVKLTASAGSSYKWSNGATTQSITVTMAGTYSVIVTYANGCKAPSVSQTVTVNPKPVVNVTASGPLNFCPGGSVTLDAGVANAYQWNNGATTRTITVNKSGNYSVTINNGNGCTATSSNVCVTVTDNVPPTITAPANITVTSGQPIVLGTPVANDNCSVTVTNNAPSVYPVGVTTVTWTARDGSGNTATAIQKVTVVAPVVCNSSITVIPENNVYTGGVPTNIYIGYGPQKVTLKATGTGGSSYSYSWKSIAGGGSLSSTTSSQPVFCPSKEGYYTFEVRITNSAGCVSTSQVSICVKDIRVDDDCNDWGWRSSSSSKVYISRRYGNTNNYTVLQVRVSDVANHLKCYPNDKLGKGLTGCVSNALSSPVSGMNSATVTAETVTVNSGGKIINTPVAETELDVQVMGNPSYNYFTVRVSSKESTPVQVKVVDMYGRTVESKANQNANSTLQLGAQYQTGTYFAEFRQGSKRKVVQLIKIKH